VFSRVEKGRPLAVARGGEERGPPLEFKKNFDLTHRQRRRYIQASLFFTFRLEA
jgi:hypothetical protein